MGDWLTIVVVLSSLSRRDRASCSEVGCGCLAWILLALGALWVLGFFEG